MIDPGEQVIVYPDEVWAEVREHLGLPQPEPGAWHA